MKQVTERQAEVLEMIRGYIEREGLSPSVRDVAEFMGVCIRAAEQMLKSLENKGIITKRPGIARSIVIMGMRKDPLADGAEFFCSHCGCKNVVLPKHGSNTP